MGGGDSQSPQHPAHPPVSVRWRGEGALGGGKQRRELRVEETKECKRIINYFFTLLFLLSVRYITFNIISS